MYDDKEMERIYAGQEFVSVPVSFLSRTKELLKDVFDERGLIAYPGLVNELSYWIDKAPKPWLRECDIVELQVSLQESLDRAEAFISKTPDWPFDG